MSAPTVPAPRLDPMRHAVVRLAVAIAILRSRIERIEAQEGAR